MKRSLPRALALAVLTLASACSQVPPAKLVVLSTSPTASPAKPVPGKPGLYVHRVSVPEYLDTYDIIARSSAHLLVTEADHKWAEKLPDAVTRVIRATLQADGFAVSDNAALELQVDIDAFEPRPGGPCVLAARWQVTETEGAHRVVTQGAATLEKAIPPGETGQAEAMEAAARELSQRIESGL